MKSPTAQFTQLPPPKTRLPIALPLRRRLLVSCLGLVLGACATAPASAPPASAPANAANANTAAAPPSASTSRAPAEQLARAVNEWHDAALVADATPFFFSEERILAFAHDFIARACPSEAKPGLESVSPECNRRFGAAVAGILHERYFAADTDAIQSHCRAEPLTCEDARTFEVLFREEHNVGIERSRADKLQRIQDWKAGRLTDVALEQALHIQFQLSTNGELITHLPTPTAARDPAGG